jgi:hypothetical protein
MSEEESPAGQTTMSETRSGPASESVGNAPGEKLWL